MLISERRAQCCELMPLRRPVSYETALSMIAEKCWAE